VEGNSKVSGVSEMKWGRGLTTSLSALFTSARAVISSCTTASKPQNAACWIGVLPTCARGPFQIPSPVKKNLISPLSPAAGATQAMPVSWPSFHDRHRKAPIHPPTLEKRAPRSSSIAAAAVQ
jgi:hypothetical protein